VEVERTEVRLVVDVLVEVEVDAVVFTGSVVVEFSAAPSVDCEKDAASNRQSKRSVKNKIGTARFMKTVTKRKLLKLHRSLFRGLKLKNPVMYDHMLLFAHSTGLLGSVSTLLA
jgi:hypothetical protein